MKPRISNPVRQPGKPRRLSRAGGRACGEAGRANLERWRSAQDMASAAVERESERFRARLLADLGDNRTAETDALVLSAVTAYAGLYRLYMRLVRGRRVKRLDAVLDRAARLQSGLARTLRALLPHKGAESGEPASIEALFAELENEKAGNADQPE